MTPVTTTVKVEFVKTEATDEEAEDSPVVVETAAVARSAPVELAACVGLPLSAIDSWSLDQMRTWLKCMFTKHIDIQALDESQSMALELSLAAINSVMLRSHDLSLDRLLDVVQMRLGSQLADKLRGELVAWRQAARDALHRLSQAPRRRGGVAPSPLRALWSSSPPQSSLSSTSRRRNWRGGSGGGGGGSGGDLLWEHLLRLLMTRDPAVRWLHPQLGHFQFVRSGAAAKSWGQTKNNENMSFEKMSRSIRQYYRQRSGVIQKVSNKARLQYQFNMRHPDVVQFIRLNFPEFLHQHQHQHQQHQQQASFDAGSCHSSGKSFE